jgi:hypothetical protein
MEPWGIRREVDEVAGMYWQKLAQMLDLAQSQTCPAGARHRPYAALVPFLFAYWKEVEEEVEHSRWYATPRRRKAGVRPGVPKTSQPSSQALSNAIKIDRGRFELKIILHTDIMWLSLTEQYD